MTPTQVTSALATRRTVRIAYHRAADTHDVDVVLGEQVDCTIARGITSEHRAEQLATDAGRLFDLDTTRIDLP